MKREGRKPFVGGAFAFALKNSFVALRLMDLCCTPASGFLFEVAEEPVERFVQIRSQPFELCRCLAMWETCMKVVSCEVKWPSACTGNLNHRNRSVGLIRPSLLKGKHLPWTSSFGQRWPNDCPLASCIVSSPKLKLWTSLLLQGLMQKESWSKESWQLHVKHRGCSQPLRNLLI